MSDLKPDVLHPAENLEGVGHDEGRGVTLLDFHGFEDFSHACVVDVSPILLRVAAQEVARQLLELLAEPEGLVGDIDIDAESSTTGLDRLWNS